MDSASRLAFAATLDVGVPDGVMAGGAYRPVGWLRLQAAAGTNAVSFGYRGGLAVVPFGVGPSLTLQAGHYLEGNANPLAAKVAGADYEASSTAAQLGYRFASAHVGVDLGEERFTFFVHGGVSHVRAKLHHVGELLANETGEDAVASISVGEDPVLRAWIPSLSLGFLLYLA